MARSSEVTHLPHEHRFVIPLEEGEGVLEYRLSPAAEEGGAATVVNFTRTFVPPPHRGRGVAEALVRRGLKWARENEYRIEASCWYVAKFLR